MLKLLEIKPETLSRQPTDLPQGLPSSTSPPPNPTYAAERARLMFGCYRKGDANDPETYVAAVTAVLAEYPPDVVKRVTDPRTGIPRKMKFMPNPAEVSEFCDEAKSAIRAEEKLMTMGWQWNGERWEKVTEPR